MGGIFERPPPEQVQVADGTRHTAAELFGEAQGLRMSGQRLVRWNPRHAARHLRGSGDLLSFFLNWRVWSTPRNNASVWGPMADRSTTSCTPGQCWMLSMATLCVVPHLLRSSASVTSRKRPIRTTMPPRARAELPLYPVGPGAG